MTAGLQYDCNTQRFSAEAEGGIYLNILTEEELKTKISYIERNSSLLYRDVVLSLLKKIENSHIEILSANAELSFKNQKYKEVIDKVKERIAPDGFLITVLNKALEELKS